MGSDPPTLKELQISYKLAAESQALAGLPETAAAKVYAQKHQLGKEAVGLAHEIQISAEIKLGEILREMEKNTGGNPDLQPVGKGNQLPPTHKELGVSKDLAAESQALAGLPETAAAKALGVCVGTINRDLGPVQSGTKPEIVPAIIKGKIAPVVQSGTNPPLAITQSGAAAGCRQATPSATRRRTSKPGHGTCGWSAGVQGKLRIKLVEHIPPSMIGWKKSGKIRFSSSLPTPGSTSHDWIVEKRKDPVFFQPPASRQGRPGMVGKPQPTIHGWIIEKRKDPVFDNPPDSRRHFDVWSFQKAGRM